MGQKYLSVNLNGTIGFKDNLVNPILETDVLISDDIYNRFFELQNNGKHLRVINPDLLPNNIYTFEDIFEEYTPEPVPHVPTETELIQQQLADLTYQLMQSNAI